jgi:hypothetical protein
MPRGKEGESMTDHEDKKRRALQQAERLKR